MVPTILIIEDSRAVQAAYASVLDDKATVLSAMTHTDAIDIFNSHPEIAGVVVDGRVPVATEGHLARPTSTVGVVEFIRKSGFAGPIVAITADESLRKPMTQAGCNGFCLKNDSGLLNFLISLLAGL